MCYGVCEVGPGYRSKGEYGSGGVLAVPHLDRSLGLGAACPQFSCLPPVFLRRTPQPQTQPGAFPG